MLNAFRKHAYSWMVRAILFLIVVVFAFWGIGTGLFNQVHPLASVDGQTILTDEVDRQADQMRRTLQRMYGANALDALKTMNLRQEALGQVIEDRLLQRESRRIGLDISDTDLQDKIASGKAFQVNGQFDFDTYQAVLSQNDLSPAEFEQQERQEMTTDLLRRMVTQGVQISDGEARLDFDQRNAKLALAYVPIPYSQFAAKVSPTDKQMADYYNRSSEKFREPERVKILLVDYEPSALAEKLNPSDKEIEDYYDKNKSSEFTHPFQVRARHILISIPGGATAKEKADAKAKAEGILRQIKAHPHDFAALAAKFSDDPGTKDNGGDLGYFGRGQMVKPFEDAVFKLKPGQVTMVESQFGYHVVEAEDSRAARVDTLVQARPEIIDTLRRKTGGEIARKALNADLAAALAGQDLKDLAQKRGLQAVETPFFAADEPVKGAEKTPELAREAFKLQEGDTRAIAGTAGESYLIKLIKRAPSHIPPLAEIRPKVREALVQEMAEQAASDFAESILKQIKTADDFSRVAASNKLEVHTTGEFGRAEGSLPVVGRFPEATDAAGVVIKVPGVIDRVLEHAGDSYLFEVLSRRPPDNDQWKKDGPAFTDRMLEQQREQAWRRFTAGLKEHARITVDANQLGGPAESSM